jgi:hypothetical protein
MSKKYYEPMNARPWVQGCHANRDGDCGWEGCPQLRDDEPKLSGRHCPLDPPTVTGEP